MKKEKYIDIDCMPDGSVEMEGNNFVGPECDTFMKPFEKLFNITKRKNKGDIYKQERVTNRRQGRG